MKEQLAQYRSQIEQLTEEAEAARKALAAQTEKMTRDMNALAGTKGHDYDFAKAQVEGHIANIEKRINELTKENRRLQERVALQDKFLREAQIR